MLTPEPHGARNTPVIDYPLFAIHMIVHNTAMLLTDIW